jgi:transposase
MTAIHGGADGGQGNLAPAVHPQIGEVVSLVPPVATATTKAEAEELTDRIRDALANLAELYAEAWAKRVDIVLGYKSWQAYCVGEFGKGERAIQARQHVVALLRGEGLTQLQIANDVGVSKPTVGEDLAAAAKSGELGFLPEKIISTNGKSYRTRQGAKGAIGRRERQNVHSAKVRTKAKTADVDLKAWALFAQGMSRKTVADKLDIGDHAAQLSQTRYKYAVTQGDVPAPGGAKDTKQTEQKKAKTAELKGIKDSHAESLYAAMLNAPSGAITLPLTNRATKVVEVLGDLADLDPGVAASQVAAVRCREYAGTAGFGEWWVKFAAACEVRRAAETPKLAHLKRVSDPKWKHAVLHGQSAEGEAERALPPVARAVLDLLRASDEPLTEAQLGVGISTAKVGKVLAVLVADGLAEVAGQEGGVLAYQIAQPWAYPGKD